MSIVSEYKGTFGAILFVAICTVLYLNVGYVKYDADSMETFESAFESSYDLQQINSRTQESYSDLIPGSAVRARIYNVSGIGQQAGLLLGATSTDKAAESYVLSNLKGPREAAKIDNQTYAVRQSDQYQEEYPEDSQDGYHRVSTYRDGVVAELLLPEPVGITRARSLAYDLQDALGYGFRQADPPLLAIRPLLVAVIGEEKQRITAADVNGSISDKTYIIGD